MRRRRRGRRRRRRGALLGLVGRVRKIGGGTGQAVPGWGRMAVGRGDGYAAVFEFGSGVGSAVGGGGGG
jgi:hypothetical protein